MSHNLPQHGMEMTTGFVVGISECCSWQMLIEDEHAIQGSVAPYS